MPWCLRSTVAAAKFHTRSNSTHRKPVCPESLASPVHYLVAKLNDNFNENFSATAKLLRMRYFRKDFLMTRCQVKGLLITKVNRVKVWFARTLYANIKREQR